ncbi:hypothetical protein D3C76_325970 [compost metagenome]
MGGEVGELVRASDVSHRQYAGVVGGEEAIDCYGATGGQLHPQLFEPEAADVGHPAERQQQLIPLNQVRFLPPAQLQPDRQSALNRGLIVGALSPPAGEQGYAVVGHLFGQRLGHLPLFPGQQLIGELHQGDGNAEQGQTLGQLAADGAAAEHQQVAGRFAQLPEAVRGEVGHLLETRQPGHHRPGAGGDDDVAAAQASAVHLQLPGGDEAGPALDALHPQSLIAFNRIVGLDLLDHRRYPCHHGGKIGL